MTTKMKLKLLVMWGKKPLISSSFYSFGNFWLRGVTVRELLMHVVKEADANLSFDDAESITLDAIEQTSTARRQLAPGRPRRESGPWVRHAPQGYTTFPRMKSCWTCQPGASEPTGHRTRVAECA